MQLRQFAAVLAALLLPLAAAAADPQPADSAPAAKKFDVKNTFRNICGFCHEDYGRKAGKGPQLMANPNSDQFLFDRIKKGKPGRMAAFSSAFTDEQIWEIVKFIRALEPGVNP